MNAVKEKLSGLSIFYVLFTIILLPGITMAQAPTISSFTPVTGVRGTLVTINGTNFTGATSVKFGGVPASSFFISSATQIRAFVGAGASGSVSVTNASGTASLPWFTFTGPIIYSFFPTTAAKDTLVTIYGKNFTNVNAVRFGGILATSFSILSDTVITAIVGIGASGGVSVYTPTTLGTLSGFTHLGPHIFSYTPRGGPTGTNVTINGINFTSLNSVTFGGVPAASFTIVSPTVITAVTAPGSAGNIEATSIYGTGIVGGFNYPKINSFTPTSGTYGTVDTIKGSNLTGATAVYFGNVAAQSFNVLSDTVIAAIVGTGASGRVRVTNASGGDSLSNFTYTFIAPVITSFTPTAAPYLGVVTIKGNHFSGTNNVAFGGMQAYSFTVNSDTVITATVSIGFSGLVSVTNPAGTGTLSGFTFLEPTITSFTPDTGHQTTPITIKGTLLNYTTSVRFGNVAAPYTILNDTTILANVGMGASGNVSVSGGANESSLPGFTYTGPYVTGLTPTQGSEGDTVQISGTGFTGVHIVTFGDTAARSFTVVSPNLIRAVVGNGSSGLLHVESSLGYHYSFAFYMKPILNSFTPQGGKTGDTITLRGKFLDYLLNIKFGGTTAQYVLPLTDTLVRAIVGAGSSGNASITTNGGTASLPGFTFYIPPVITGFSPNYGGPSTPVTITGNNFLYADSVFFGGVSAASFTIINNNTIIAFPGNTGADGAITVHTLGGVTSTGSFQYFGKPVITSFNANQNGPGARVYIRGQNLYATVQAPGGAFNSLTVKFGGVLSPSAGSSSDSLIVATVPPTVSGYVYVQTPGGKDSMPGFIFKPVPAIQTITPAMAAAGSTITITGSNFNPTPANNIVAFGAARANVTAASATSLSVTVPNGATFEPLSVTVNGLTGYSRKPFVVTYAGAGSFSFDSYGSRTHINTGFKPKALIADIDGDGRNDLVVSERMNASIKIFLNNGTTPDTITFAAPVNIPVCAYHLLEAIKDMDGDGQPDILLICDTSDISNYPHSLGLFKNNSVPGAVSFTASPAPFTLPISGKSPVPVDVSGDGMPDIPLASIYYTHIGSEYINQYQYVIEGGVPKYEFWYNVRVNNGISDTRIATTTSIKPADMNNDGHTDLVIGLAQSTGSFAGHYFTILQNNGTLSLYAPQYTRHHYPGADFTTMFPRPGDLNGDSLPDIIRDTVAYINTGNFNFTTQQNTCVDCDFVADMDGDGKPDLVKFANDTIGIVRNKTTGPTINFSPKVNFYAGRNASHYAIGDLNGDGKPEIVVSRYNDSTISILKNKVGDVIRLCPGGSATLISNISGATYQWQVNTGSGYTNLSDNTTYTGTQTASMSLANLPDSMNGYRYRCVTNNGDSYTFTLKFENIWTSSASTAWENPANWSCGSLPTQYTDVVIGSGSIVVVGANAICKSLTMMPGSSVTVLPGFTLTVVQ